MSVIPIMLRSVHELPTTLQNYADTLNMSDIEKRHALAVYCRQHGMSADQLKQTTGSPYIKYALSKAPDSLHQIDWPNKPQQFTGLFIRPSGYRDTRSVTVVDVDITRPWMIIQDSAAPHMEQVVYLDNYTPTNWNNFHAIGAWGPEPKDEAES